MKVLLQLFIQTLPSSKNLNLARTFYINKLDSQFYLTGRAEYIAVIRGWLTCKMENRCQTFWSQCTFPRAMKSSGFTDFPIIYPYPMVCSIFAVCIKYTPIILGVHCRFMDEWTTSTTLGLGRPILFNSFYIIQVIPGCPESLSGCSRSMGIPGLFLTAAVQD